MYYIKLLFWMGAFFRMVETSPCLHQPIYPNKRKFTVRKTFGRQLWRNIRSSDFYCIDRSNGNGISTDYGN